MKFAAVAFDLDGTLYPDFRLYVRLVPFFLKDSSLLFAMGKAREILRASSREDSEAAGSEGGFYERQARLMAGFLNEPFEKVRERTERLIYRGWERHFRKIALFPHVRETLDDFRGAGIPMGLLSDFPPPVKLEYLGLSSYWKTVLCSEEVGRLKPDPASFLELSLRLGFPPERILYVGNSLSYDVGGAGGAGMKTALVRRGFFRGVGGRKLASSERVPDFVFRDYRQLREYVLG